MAEDKKQLSELIPREMLRNVAIIAHVDHGKTTLVDEMLKQSGTFRQNQVVQERVMDSGDIERERGITILAKNTAVHYKDVKINIVDTPGHADFGGEVERVLKMVDGVILIVDAFEGPMPQTRFVLRRALELGHRAIVVINKVDRPDARALEVADMVLDLFIELEADEDQLDCPFLYASARQGLASADPAQMGENLVPLFDAILAHVPPPPCTMDGELQMLVSTIDHNDYVGRIGVGRVERGVIRQGMEIALCTYGKQEPPVRQKAVNLYVFDGLKRVAVNQAGAGDIVAVSGVDGIDIGDTLCDPARIDPLPFAQISPPTVAMTFSVNDSPFAGRDGKFITTRHLRARLMREREVDVSLRVEETATPDSFRVSGRGELHLSILIETMRRQGYELQVSQPQVLMRVIDGVKCEPMERVVADVPETAIGSVIEKLGKRRGELVTMHTSHTGRTRLELVVPARGLFGYRSDFLTDTRGEGILTSVFDGYAPYKGDLPKRSNGVLIASETGESVMYGLYQVQPRGQLFIGPATPVYAGMIVGQTNRAEDITVNVCKKKHLTGVRGAGSEEAMILVNVRYPTLEEALEWMADDELLEITPKHLRLRKKILDPTLRMRAGRNAKAEEFIVQEDEA